MVLFYFLILTGGAVGYWVMLQHLKNEGFAYYFLMYLFYPFGFISGIYIFISEMRGAYKIQFFEEALRTFNITGKPTIVPYADIEHIGERTSGHNYLFSELFVRTHSGMEIIITWDTPMLGEIMERIISESRNLESLNLNVKKINQGIWKKPPDTQLLEEAYHRAEENRGRGAPAPAPAPKKQ
jgi:hypothetical protein